MQRFLRVFVGIVFVSSIVLAILLHNVWGQEKKESQQEPAVETKNSQQTTNTDQKPGRPFNVLLVGLDTGEFPMGKKREGIGRTDTIILARIDPQKQAVNILSIPRDTLVRIPGRDEDKINHAYPFGGMPLVLETIQQFTGVPVDYYVRVDYKCLEEIIKELGTVQINVTEELHYKYYDIHPGTVDMSAEQAFVYLRLRNVPGGDITRTVRQQRFCLDLAREIKKPENWPHLPKIYLIISNYGDTNISLLECFKILKSFNSLDNAKFTLRTVPGENYMKGGIYYWKPDLDKTNLYLTTMFNN